MVHFINLPADKDIITNKVVHSRNCFLKAAGNASASREARDTKHKGGGMAGLGETTARSDLFMFVMEDTETGACLGTCQLLARMGGADNPNVSFQLSEKQFFSKSLQTGTSHTVATLHLDGSGPTEIGGLILQPSFRRHKQKLGRQLSLIRFHFIALHRELFADRMLAEMMAPISADGHNLLWDFLGRRFINLSYTEADRFCQYSRAFMTELLPPEPIYLSLLPPVARALVGEVGPETVPAKIMLERLGFKDTGCIDPFDGGPHLDATTDEIPVVETTKYARLGEPVKTGETKKLGLISMVDSDGEFHAIQTQYTTDSRGRICINIAAMKSLQAEPNNKIGLTPLDQSAPKPRKKKTKKKAAKRKTKKAGK